MDNTGFVWYFAGFLHLQPFFRCYCIRDLWNFDFLHLKHESDAHVLAPVDRPAALEGGRVEAGADVLADAAALRAAGTVVVVVVAAAAVDLIVAIAVVLVLCFARHRVECVRLLDTS